MGLLFLCGSLVRCHRCFMLFFSDCFDFVKYLLFGSQSVLRSMLSPLEGTISDFSFMMEDCEIAALGRDQKVSLQIKQLLCPCIAQLSFPFDSCLQWLPDL